MSHHEEKAAGKCPMTAVIKLATKTAKANLGGASSDKRVCTTAVLKTAVTENGKTKTVSVDAGVTLGVSVTESDDAHEHCAHDDQDHSCADTCADCTCTK